MIGLTSAAIWALIPLDGNIGEIVSIASMPILRKLVAVVTPIQQKVSIGLKRAFEKHVLKVDVSNSEIEVYDLNNEEKIKKRCRRTCKSHCWRKSKG